MGASCRKGLRTFLCFDAKCAFSWEMVRLRGEQRCEVSTEFECENNTRKFLSRDIDSSSAEEIIHGRVVPQKAFVFSCVLMRNVRFPGKW